MSADKRFRGVIPPVVTPDTPDGATRVVLPNVR